MIHGSVCLLFDDDDDDDDDDNDDNEIWMRRLSLQLSKTTG